MNVNHIILASSVALITAGSFVVAQDISPAAPTAAEVIQPVADTDDSARGKECDERKHGRKRGKHGGDRDVNRHGPDGDDA